MKAPHNLVSLPLFPLHTVLFPHGHLPLRVFEPRYRSMVQCCREQGAPFGVVTLLSGDEVRKAEGESVSFHLVGTLAFIDAVMPLSTGLELLECTGSSRFRITGAQKTKGNLWVANVDVLPADLPMAIPHDLQATAQALRQVLKKLPMHHLESASEAQWNDCGWVANRWCELLPMKQQLQLQLLELDSPLLRLELVNDALERAGIVY